MNPDGGGDRQASQSMSARLVAELAHELNDPLQVILGHAEQALVSDESLSDRNRQRLSDIRDCAIRAADVVRGLLVFGRQRRLLRTTVYPHAVLESVLAVAAWDLARDAVMVRTEWDVHAAVRADPSLLEEVLTHLVRNAQEAMRTTGGTLSLRVERVDEAAPRVRVTVEDTGPGIEPALRERVFDPFYSSKRGGDGNGLGLAICRGIVAEHGGVITASGRAHGGAVLIVDLPALNAPAAGI